MAHPRLAHQRWGGGGGFRVSASGEARARLGRASPTRQPTTNPHFLMGETNKTAGIDHNDKCSLSRIWENHSRIDKKPGSRRSQDLEESRI